MNQTVTTGRTYQLRVTHVRTLHIGIGRVVKSNGRGGGGNAISPVTTGDAYECSGIIIGIVEWIFLGGGGRPGGTKCVATRCGGRIEFPPEGFKLYGLVITGDDGEGSNGCRCGNHRHRRCRCRFETMKEL